MEDYTNTRFPAFLTNKGSIPSTRSTQILLPRQVVFDGGCIKNRS
jgi:hypothetical protein